jgi:hypothetical protein
MEALVPALLEALALDGAHGWSLSMLWEEVDRHLTAPRRPADGDGPAVDSALRAWLWQTLMQYPADAMVWATGPDAPVLGATGPKRERPEDDPGVLFAVQLLTERERTHLATLAPDAAAARWPALRVVASEARRMAALGIGGEVRVGRWASAPQSPRH